MVKPTIKQNYGKNRLVKSAKQNRKSDFGSFKLIRGQSVHLYSLY